ncbi:hypothetical protein [Flavobacterium sp. XGLA_31]|uniref:hypothetical protein n=1 Tax=Flavobacterium sp. XGLA_31 TaxID=3447666 RepID=UPI003F2AA317
MGFFSDIGDSIGGALGGLVNSVTDTIHDINIGDLTSTVLNTIPGGSLINNVIQDGWSGFSLNNIVQAGTNFLPAGSFVQQVLQNGLSGISLQSILGGASSLLGPVGQQLVISALGTKGQNYSVPSVSQSTLQAWLQTAKTMIDNGQITTQQQLQSYFASKSMSTPPQFTSYLQLKIQSMQQTGLTTLQPYTGAGSQTGTEAFKPTILEQLKANMLWVILGLALVSFLVYKLAFSNKRKTRR